MMWPQFRITPSPWHCNMPHVPAKHCTCMFLTGRTQWTIDNRYLSSINSHNGVVFIQTLPTRSCGWQKNWDYTYKKDFRQQTGAYV
jgi:hypothetical protein